MNPLKSLSSTLKYNPYAKTTGECLYWPRHNMKVKKEKLDKKRNIIPKEEAATVEAAGKAWYQTTISDSDYIVFN